MQILYNIIWSVLIFAIKLLVYIFKKFKTSNLLLCLVESKIGKNIADEQRKQHHLDLVPKDWSTLKRKKSTTKAPQETVNQYGNEALFTTYTYF